MASGPWDNVQLPGPPNGPAYLSAAAQLMGAVNNDVSGLGTSYQQGQQFGQQQRQANFFQNPQNQQLLSTFLQNPNQQNYAALLQPMVQAGGMQSAGPLIDQYLGITQDQNIARQIGGAGVQQPVNAGPATSPHAAGPENITGPNTGNTTLGVTGTNLNTIAGKANANVPDQILQRIATSVGANSPEDDLTLEQAGRAQVRLNQYLKRNGGNENPVAQSGNGDQEAASTNQLNPSTGQGSPAMTPRQTGERRIAQEATAPAGTFNDRFAPTGVTRAGAETVAQTGGTRASPLGDQAKVDAMNTRIQQLRAMAAAYARRSPAAAQQADKAADDMVKERDKLLESLSKYNEPGTNPEVKRQLEASGGLGAALGKRQGEVVEAGGLAARHTIGTIDTMQDAFRRSAGKLPEGPFAENTLKFKQAVNNYIPGFFDQGAIVDATAVTKLNAQLAAEAAKAMTARPSQLEFRAFMANNPGLTTGVDGALFLSEVIKRTKAQDIKLSSLAAKTSPDQWPSVEEKFYSDPKNQLFTDAERKNPYLVIGQRGPSASQPSARPTAPGQWRELAPGIRIREKPNPANQT